jgi:hypothetical protein
MTSPNEPPPPPSEQGAPTAIILAAIVAALIAGSTVATIIALLVRLAGMQVEALRFLFRRSGPLFEATVIPRPNTGSWTEPQFQQYNQNVHRRASYLINAGRRVSRAYTSGGLAGMRAAYEREKTYWAQHKHAAAVRHAAAHAVGEAMARYSEVRLGWHAVMDERTSAECRQAHGRNFDPQRIPPIGYPGSVHPHCRCRPGVPFVTSRRVETIRPDRGAWAA